jgi:hypothetical protein
VYALVNNRAKGNAPLTVQGLVKMQCGLPERILFTPKIRVPLRAAQAEAKRVYAK